MGVRGIDGAPGDVGDQGTKGNAMNLSIFMINDSFRFTWWWI